MTNVNIAPVYDLEYKGFRVRAFLGLENDQDADIEITRHGEPYGQVYRSFKYPAYRIWNIAAHFNEIIDDVLRQENEAGREPA